MLPKLKLKLMFSVLLMPQNRFLFLAGLLSSPVQVKSVSSLIGLGFRRDANLHSLLSLLQTMQYLYLAVCSEDMC